MESGKVEYRAVINKDTLEKWHGIRVWDKPQSAVDGAEVVDQITEPLEVKVVEEQNWNGSIQRFKIAYGSKQGWVLADAITKI
jgi:hypothetical protein